MSSQIHVESDALTELLAGFKRFACVAPELLAQVHSELQWRLEEVERRREAQRGEVERLRSLCESAASADEDSEESAEDYSAELETAEDRLVEISAAVQQVEEAMMKLNAVTARSEALLTDRTHSACAFLQRKLEELADYRSAHLSGTSAGFGRNFAVGTSEISAKKAVSPQTPAIHSEPPTARTISTPLTAFRLPSGFKWVSLDRIALDEELKDVEASSAFQKTTYDVMLRGFQRLRAEVLPAIETHGISGAAAHFTARDGLSSGPPEESLQRVYEAFFGSDPIYLDRGASAEGLCVMSGRHRLKVARDLGWSAVPARVSPRVSL